HTIYIGLTGLVINLVVSVALTLVFRAVELPGGSDETWPEHYVADPEPAAAEPVPVAAGAADAA
ncbi:MAG: sodium:solute symporter, partial [Gemmatimonadales bacterium]